MPLPTLAEIRDDNNIPARLALISGLNHFKGVSEATCRKIAENCEYAHYAPREPIVKQNARVGAAYIILRGVLEISHSITETKLTVFGPQEITRTEYYLPYRGAGYLGGQNNAICGDRHDYNVRAAMDCDLLLIDHRALNECFDTSPVFARNSLFYLRILFRETAKRLHQLASLELRHSRVVLELLEIADALTNKVIAHPGDKDHRIKIDWLDRGDLASKIGSSDNVVGEALQRLRVHRLIASGEKGDKRGTIYIEPADLPKFRLLLDYLRTDNPPPSFFHRNGLENAIRFLERCNWKPNEI